MLYRYAATALIALAVGFGSAWRVQSWRHDANERERVEAEQAELARTARQTFRAQEVRDAETIRINERLADALERLRERPARLPEPARVTCQGATGAELSGPDAGFLQREAARADSLREALRECYAWVDAVRGQPDSR